MHVFIVHAHPEPESLNGALTSLAVSKLKNQGHEVTVSDLYRMGWNATAGPQDFRQRSNADRLVYIAESGHAFHTGTQAEEIAEEQAKLLRADAVILQFPIWWYSMPAILKGWFDRVYAFGFAYGVGEVSENRWFDRYGEGTLAGRRAMLSVTVGGRESHYTRRGVNGHIDDLLFPINHGCLFYPGMTVLPSFIAYETAVMAEGRWEQVSAEYERRLEGLFTDDPIPYRTQNGGHYDGRQELKPGFGANAAGLDVHLLQAGDPAETFVQSRTAS